MWCGAVGRSFTHSPHTSRDSEIQPHNPSYQLVLASEPTMAPKGYHTGDSLRAPNKDEENIPDHSRGQSNTTLEPFTKDVVTRKEM